jgi:predicted small metal-binding protein
MATEQLSGNETCQNSRFLAGFIYMKAIYCRDFGYDCNAMMRGRTIDEAVDATIKHGVSMHKQNLKDLQTPEKRAEIASKAKEYEAPAKK